MLPAFLIVISVKEMCYLTVFLVGNDRVQIYVFNAAENVCLDLWIALFQLCDKVFYLKPF